jgi:DNA-binding transcriptional ArsR family regulator
MYQVTSVFKALSDPIRVEMVYRLSSGNNFSLGQLSTDLGITRQGARKHMGVLEHAQIIQLEKKGRTTEVRLNKESMELIKDFILHLEKQWDRRLLALKAFVEKEAT